jgi:xylulokinase
MHKPAASSELIIGIDQGTSTLKVVAFAPSGHVVTSVAAATEIHLSGDGAMEMRPERWWSQCAAALRALLADPAVAAGRLRAVSVCGLMHTLVAVDATGRSIADAIPLWADQRYRSEPSRAYEAVSDRVAELSANSCVGRLAWLLDRHPSARSRVRHLLPVKDFLRFKLTGEAVTDCYEAVGTGLAGEQGAAWSSELLDVLGLPGRCMPRILPPDSQAGVVTAAAAESTRLPAGTPVVVGTSDFHAALFGSAAFLPDRISLYLGTAGVLGAFRSRTDLSTFGQAACLGATTSAGSALEWLGHALCPDGSDQDLASLARLARRSEPGARGLIFLPHLMGERGDSIRPQATGTLTGLRLTHDRCDLARAVLEGAAVWLRLVSGKALPHEGIGSLVISGGGAREPLNAEIAAAIYRMPVMIPEVTETGALGVAMLAARSLGIVGTDAAAAGDWFHVRHVHEPIPALVDRYAGVMAAFVQTEQVMRTLELDQRPTGDSLAP